MGDYVICVAESKQECVLVARPYHSRKIHMELSWNRKNGNVGAHEQLQQQYQQEVSHGCVSAILS